MTPEPLIDLGSHLIDPSNQCLVRDGERVSLRPKAFATLMLLAGNPQRIVTKDELLDGVWPDTVVGDAVLKVCVRELRVALGDSSKHPRFIETVHRRGYRFLVVPKQAEVQVSESPGSDPAPAQAQLPPEGAAPAVEGPIVGREAELERLEEFWRLAEAGQRQLVLLSGDAGIGKTSTLQSFRQRIPSARFVQGSCREQFGAGEPFLPVLEALGTLIGKDPLGPLVQQLRERAPTWFVQFPWLVTDDDRDRLEREILGTTRQRMLREMAEFLEFTTAEDPLVIVFEDLHWSDPSTLDLVCALALRGQPARVLVLMTYRPVDVIVHDHPLRRAKSDLLRSPGGTEVALGFLGRDEIGGYLERRLGGQPFPPALTAWLFLRTDGSPLFLVQIVDFLMERGWLCSGPEGWTFDQRSADTAKVVPRTLREMIVEDLSACSDAQRELLEAASLAGFRFSSAAVAAALEQDPAEVEATASSLASRGQFIREIGWVEFPDGSAGTSYSFAHSLWQQALADSVSTGQRTRMQRRLAENGEKAFADRVAEAASELALHFEEARVPHRAIHYGLIAADRAQARSAYLEADLHLVNALALSESLPEPDRWPSRATSLQRLGLLRRANGDMSAASEVFEQWAAEARSHGDANDEAKARLLCASTTSWADKDRCLGHVARARELEGLLSDQVSMAHLLGSCAYWELLWKGWNPGQEKAIAQASKIAWAAQDRVIANQHDVRLSFLQALRGDYALAAKTAHGAREMGFEIGDPSEMMLAEFFGAWALIQGEQWSAAEDWILAASQAAERNGNRPWLVLFGLMDARLKLQQGQLAEAGAGALASLEEARAAGLVFGERYAGALLGAVRLEEGDVDAAASLLAGVHDRFDADPGLLDWFTRLECLLGMARCARQQGRSAAARDLAQEGHALAKAMGEPHFLGRYAELLEG